MAYRDMVSASADSSGEQTDSSPDADTGAPEPQEPVNRIKPSHERAKQLYEWAMENIEGAENTVLQRAQFSCFWTPLTTIT